MGEFSHTLHQLEFDTFHPPAGCDSVSFPTEHPHALTETTSALCSKLSLLPFGKQRLVLQKPTLLFVDFPLASLPFSFPRLHNKTSHSYGHPCRLSFLSTTLDFLFGICCTQLTTFNFNDFLKNSAQIFLGSWIVLSIHSGDSYVCLFWKKIVFLMFLILRPNEVLRIGAELTSVKR